MKKFIIALFFGISALMAQEKNQVIILSNSTVNPEDVVVTIAGMPVENVEVISMTDMEESSNAETIMFIDEEGGTTVIKKKSEKMCEDKSASCDETSGKKMSCCEGKETNIRLQKMALEDPDGPQKMEIKKIKVIKMDGQKGSPEMTFWEDENSKVKIFIDGKESTKEQLKNMDQDKIKTIDVMKGDKAIKKYGEEAKDGVIKITTI